MSEKLPQPAICIHTCAHQGRLPLSVTLPLPSVTLIFWNLTSGQKWRTEGAVTASLSSVSHHLSYTTKKEKPLCQAGRHDLWLPCFYLCKTVLVFFFFSWKYCHWIYRLFLCRSFGQQFAPYSRGSSVSAFGVSLIGSTWGVSMGREGKGVVGG